MPKLSPTDIEKVAEQLSLDSLLEDYLLSEEQLAHWKARKDRDKDVMAYKLIHEDLENKVVTSTVHQASEMTLQQFSFVTGDYNIVTQEKVSTNFNKKHIQEHILLKLSRAEHARNTYRPEPIAETTTREELEQEVQTLRRQLIEQQMELLIEIEKDYRNSTTYTKHCATEPRFIGSNS